MPDRPTVSLPAAPDATTAAADTLPAADLNPPPATPRYVIGAEIARGGMGVVYHATDAAFDRPVAIKVLRDGGTARRFADEARITGQLQHPAIPPVHDLGTLPDGTPFLAMKLIKGDTLHDLLKARPDPAADRGRFVAAFEKVCEAVAYAHAHRVIHRDLKPANVMVGSFGEVQVMDWGLAKVLDPSAAAAGGDPDATAAPTVVQGTRDSDDDQTQAGSVLGTPAFMPPEQALGAVGKVGPRSDVFGLGAILAVVLTGKPPFAGTSAETTRIQAAQGKVDACFARLDASGAEPELIALCKRCLSPDPAARPADAGEVARAVADLRQAADERARRAELDIVKAELRAAELRKRRRVQLALAAAVLILVAGGGAAAWWVEKREGKRHAEALQHELDAERRDADDRARKASRQAVKGLIRNYKPLEDDPEGTIAICREAIRLDADNVQAHILLANAFIARKSWADAELEFREALRIEPNAERVRLFLARMLRNQGKHAEAADEFREAYRISPNLRQNLVIAADTFAANKSLDKATDGKLATDDVVTLYRTALIMLPADAPLWVKLGNVLREQKKFDEALAAYKEAFRCDPNSAADYQNQLGCILHDKKEYDGAESAYKESIRLNPKLLHPIQNLALTRKDKGDLPGAVAAYRQAIQLNPHEATMYHSLGLVLYELKDWDGIIAAELEAIRLAPNYPDALNNLGHAYSRKNDLDHAIAAFREAVRLSPDYFQPHLRLGIALNDSGDVEGAITAYRRARQIEPKNAQACVGLGLGFIRKGEYDLAVIELDEAVRLDPKAVNARVNLGSALASKGDLDGGIVEYRKALQLDPKDSGAANGLKNAERDREQLRRLSDVLAGKAQPRSPRDRCEFGMICYAAGQKRYAKAVDFFSVGLQEDPLLAGDLDRDYRYNAACCAVLAASGAGIDAPSDAAQRSTLRGNALTWLREGLDLYQKKMRAVKAFEPQMANDLVWWLQDPDLATLRPGVRRVGMPAAERAEWDKLWDDVKATIAEARRKPSTK